MTWISVVGLYLGWQLALSAVSAASRAIVQCSTLPRLNLRLVRACVLLACLSPWLAAYLVPDNPLTTWQHTFEPLTSGSTSVPGLTLLDADPSLPETAMSSPALGWLVASTWFAGFAWCGARILSRRRSLARSICSTTLLRCIGRVELRCAPIDTPATLRLGSRVIVLIDHATACSPRQLRIALAHEFAHHRHGDPAWSLLTQWIAAASWLNPLVTRRLLAQLSLAEEFACDHAVLHGGTVSVRDYCWCLVLAVRTGSSMSLSPSAMGLRPRSRSALYERIDRMTQPQKNHRLRLAGLTAAVSLTVLATAAAAAPRRTVDPQTFARLCSSTGPTDLVVPAHSTIRARLQAIVESDRARASYRSGLARFPAHAHMIESALTQKGLPVALSAVALVESRFNPQAGYDRPAPKQPDVPFTIGLWQFIPATAHAYGLRVDATVDERLDPVKETAAALALLDSLYRETGDWGLALSAYHHGLPNVRAAQARMGINDAWGLIEAGALEPFAAEVMAAVLVMLEPSLVE